MTTMLDLAPSLQEPGKRLVDAGELFELFRNIADTSGPTFLDAAGTDEFTATPLGSGLNIINSIPVPDAGVVLPPATVLGRTIAIINNDQANGFLTVWAGVGQKIAQYNSSASGAAGGVPNINMGPSYCQFICIETTPVGVWKQTNNA